MDANDAETPPDAPKPEKVKVTPVAHQPPSLEDLFKAAEPMVNRWIEVMGQAEKQKHAIEEKSLALEEKTLVIDAREGRHLRWLGTGILAAMMAMVGLLFIYGKDGPADKLLTAFLSFAGGFGFASYGGSKRRTGTEEVV